MHPSVVVMLLAALSSTAPIAAAQAQPVQAKPTRELAPMSNSRFWSIVHKTVPAGFDRDRQLAALRQALSSLTLAELEAYEDTFHGLMQQSYSWDLWGAAYIINGGASDDGFEYFRCWLLSRGEAVFSKALADPDSLAELISANADEALDFEEFAYVARTVWSEKSDEAEMPNASPMMYPGKEPSGTPFAEEAAHLAKRYPKLWKRFGNAPLQYH